MLYNRRTALGVNQKQRVRVFPLSREHVLFVHSCVRGATARKQLEILFRHLRLNERTEIYIGNKQNVLLRKRFADFYRRGGSNAHVGNCFKLRRCVDIRHYRVVGVKLFNRLYFFPAELLRHRTARRGIGKVNPLLRGKHFNRFRHKAHAAHYNVFVGRCFRLYRKRVAVAAEVGYFADFLRHIAVRKDTGIRIPL